MPYWSDTAYHRPEPGYFCGGALFGTNQGAPCQYVYNADLGL